MPSGHETMMGTANSVLNDVHGVPATYVPPADAGGSAATTGLTVRIRHQTPVAADGERLYEADVFAASAAVTPKPGGRFTIEPDTARAEHWPVKQVERNEAGEWVCSCQQVEAAGANRRS